MLSGNARVFVCTSAYLTMTNRTCRARLILLVSTQDCVMHLRLPIVTDVQGGFRPERNLSVYPTVLLYIFSPSQSFFDRLAQTLNLERLCVEWRFLAWIVETSRSCEYLLREIDGDGRVFELVVSSRCAYGTFRMPDELITRKVLSTVWSRKHLEITRLRSLWLEVRHREPGFKFHK
jgi:hypothetical protein